NPAGAQTAAGGRGSLQGSGRAPPRPAGSEVTHLHLVLLLLQALQAAAVGLALHRHVRLHVHDVHAELGAEGQAVVDPHRQARTLRRETTQLLHLSSIQQPFDAFFFF
ncbi:hypothetical protein JZ751_027148, partial [Albula glossodonta]